MPHLAVTLLLALLHGYANHLHALGIAPRVNGLYHGYVAVCLYTWLR